MSEAPACCTRPKSTEDTCHTGAETGSASSVLSMSLAVAGLPRPGPETGSYNNLYKESVTFQKESSLPKSPLMDLDLESELPGWSQVAAALVLSGCSVGAIESLELISPCSHCGTSQTCSGDSLSEPVHCNWVYWKCLTRLAACGREWLGPGLRRECGFRMRLAGCPARTQTSPLPPPR